MRVAIIKIGALGDVLRTTALVPGLRRLDAGLDLTWITSRAAFPLLWGNPSVTRILDYQSLEPATSAQLQYDWVISLDDDPEPCRLAGVLRCDRLSGAHENSRGELCYTPDVEAWFGMGRLRPGGDGGLPRANQLKRANTRDYASILYDSLGLPLPVERPSLTIPPEAKAWARRWLESQELGKRTLIGLNTGAAGRWRFKSWGVADTARLANALVARVDALVMILGGPAEAKRNAEILALADSPGVIAAPCDLSISAFAALIAETALLVSSDSLAMHIGIARQRAVIAFFGPTSDSEIDLFGSGEKIVTPLECRRCYLPDCDVRPHCMQSIGVDSILDAVTRWIPRSDLQANLATLNPHPDFTGQRRRGF